MNANTDIGNHLSILAQCNSPRNTENRFSINKRRSIGFLIGSPIKLHDLTHFISSNI